MDNKYGDIIHNFEKYTKMKEKLLKKLECRKDDAGQKPSAIISSNHIAVSYRIHIQSDLDLEDIPLDYTYTGINAAIEFMKTINFLDKELTKMLYKARNKFKDLNLPEEEEIHIIYDLVVEEELLHEFIEGQLHSAMIDDMTMTRDFEAAT